MFSNTADLASVTMFDSLQQNAGRPLSYALYTMDLVLKCGVGEGWRRSVEPIV
jgi:hypothetical protein